MKRFPLLVALFCSATLAFSVHSADLEKEPTKQEIEEAGKRAEVVADIGMAHALAAYGRGESCESTTPKDFKSPESLVLAGGILLRADKVTSGKMGELDIKPTDDKGAPIAAKAEKSKSLKVQAGDLFDEARLIAAELKDPARKSAIEEMIKREEKSEPSRGAIGGPQQTTRALNPGETHSFKLAFAGGVPAAVCMTSSGPARIEFNLVHVGGTALHNKKAVSAQHSWVPPRDKNGVRMYHLTLTNLGRKPVTYNLAIN